LNGLSYKEAAKKAIEELEKLNQGKGKRITVCVMLFFSSKILGEPFPVYYVNGLPQMIDATHLPIVLPEVESIYQQKMGYRLRECGSLLGIRLEMQWSTRI
jgi:leucyl-tRNA synthetase